MTTRARAARVLAPVLLAPVLLAAVLAAAPVAAQQRPAPAFTPLADAPPPGFFAVEPVCDQVVALRNRTTRPVTVRWQATPSVAAESASVPPPRGEPGTPEWVTRFVRVVGEGSVTFSAVAEVRNDGAVPETRHQTAALAMRYEVTVPGPRCGVDRLTPGPDALSAVPCDFALCHAALPARCEARFGSPGLLRVTMRPSASAAQQQRRLDQSGLIVVGADRVDTPDGRAQRWYVWRLDDDHAADPRRGDASRRLARTLARDPALQEVAFELWSCPG